MQKVKVGLDLKVQYLYRGFSKTIDSYYRIIFSIFHRGLFANWPAVPCEQRLLGASAKAAASSHAVGAKRAPQSPVKVVASSHTTRSISYGK